MRSSDDALVVSLVLALGTDKETKNLMEDLCDQLNTVLRKGSGQNREMALFRVSRGVRRVQDRLMKHIFRTDEEILNVFCRYMLLYTIMY